MGTSGRGATARQLDALFGLGAAGERTDRQLLDRFAGGRDEAADLAFAALVERHGPMVLRICRAVLRDEHDAQDAFQATFLVLVRRRHDAPGGSDSLGPWLGGVAYRTALAARSAGARRRRLEARAARLGDRPSQPGADPTGEVGAIVREEVDRLPERFRPAVALCLLGGQSIVEAARTLGCPVGTLQSRLARGRSRLRGQLARRGLGGDGPLAAPPIPPVPSIPGALARLTARAATRVAAGSTLLDGAGSAPVAALVRRVLLMMVVAKLKAGLIAVTLLVGCLGIGGAVVARGWTAGEAAPALAPPVGPPGPVVALPTAAPVAPASPAEITLKPGDAVQKAIDAAPEGSVVRLAAGEYPENITISKPLTLIGAGWDQTAVGRSKLASRFTQAQKDEFFARLEAANTPQERTQIALALTNPRTSALTIINTAGVVVEGIRWQGPPPDNAGDRLPNQAMVVVSEAHATLRSSVVAGPAGNGIEVSDSSQLTVERCLVAGLWGTGLVARPASKVRVSDSDIRNCYYAGITLGTGDATIERCRISGSAWHGIRYDNCSPTIERCQIFGNARSGIYASGMTRAKVTGNVFWRNEMDGMSTWFDNADAVTRNTFVGNRREGFGAIGGAKPDLYRNVFLDNPVAIICARTGAGRNGGETPPGAPTVRENVFFRNPQGIKDGLDDRPLPPGNETLDPRFGGPEANFRPLTGWDEAGASDPIPLASPFPIQPGELAIIPDGETRDSNAWKKAASPR